LPEKRKRGEKLFGKMSIVSSQPNKRFLQNAFLLEQKLLQVQLELSSNSIPHPGIQGEVSEGHFVELLRRYLPKRYAVDSAIVIDSKGNTSHQIDVVIYDNQYTPTLLDQLNHRFVPAEAVYAVFEVKPTVNRQYLKYAGEKVESVRKLRRTSIEIVHAGGKFAAKPLFQIIGGIIASRMDWKNGFNSNSFKSSLISLKGNQSLNCGLSVSGCCFDTYDEIIHIKETKHSLIYFLFRLLQKLQSLGTVPAIDWDAYAKELG
jgi:hypothetical protein